MPEAHRPRVLIVDDEPINVHILSDLLSEDYTVLVATDGAHALRIAAAEPPPHLILLDIVMPGSDGFEVCRKLKANRATAAIPVVFVTTQSQVESETHGFALGADDYIAKPFHPEVVRARVRARLGRGRPAEIAVGDLTMSPQQRQAVCGGMPVDLTGAEFEVLLLLAERAGVVVGKDELSLRALQRHWSPFDRSIDNHVSRLRQKLGPHPDGQPRIATVRGRGYLYGVTPPES